ncbi:uncharacterized protein FOMMEDRAFT_145448 [Fomitiporia mediterranea MF3/22]|uniref:uncharacterized protein n=1 Tax=Fomitiporia mediterranea (strain MF3/22) TaxID=694068 RepID=UPI0004408655|nr:uncharacterized protein FOMMEDRAFT_145448 [Fomitiporia mediterranea MF3/22]EJD06190.1 hypothetical protein FOMMEDRAFT_145448 [Fomitiporia mediterranea MF3/22]
MAKKEKRFIESMFRGENDAMILAESAAKSQEEKVLNRMQHNKLLNNGRDEHQKVKKKARPSSDSRLKQAKEAVRAQVARLRKRRTEFRKAAKQGRESSETQPAKKKGVSFV